jgi:membrane-associated protein
MELVSHFVDIVLHLDRYLNDQVGAFGAWSYAILFLVVFCETGLVVTPFLPGDSLLFATGALAASEGSPLSLPILLIGLCCAAVAGDAVNYAMGFRIGPKVFRSEQSWLFNKKHLLRAQQFYEKYGGKTIILARFNPIIRTFAPFVAGIGRMRYPRFALYNVVGGAAWVIIFLLAGFDLRNVPVVKDNFHIVIAAIIFISVLPAVIEVLLARRRLPDAPSVDERGTVPPITTGANHEGTTRRTGEEDPVAAEVE